MSDSREFPVVCRIRKIRTWSGVSAASEHNLRQRWIFHANHDRAGPNQVLYAGPGVLDAGPWRADEAPMSCEAAVRKLHRELTKNARKNAVLAVEMILTANHEWFDGDETRDQQFIDAFLPALRKRYPGQLASVTIHRDEIAPHLHVLIVPIERDRTDGKVALNFDGIMGKKHHLRSLQDWAGKVGGKVGLVRGVIRSVDEEAPIYMPPEVYRDRIRRSLDDIQMNDELAAIARREAEDFRAQSAASAALVVQQAKACADDIIRQATADAKETLDQAAQRAEEVMNSATIKVKALEEQAALRARAKQEEADDEAARRSEEVLKEAMARAETIEQHATLRAEAKQEEAVKDRQEMARLKAEAKADRDQVLAQKVAMDAVTNGEIVSVQDGQIFFRDKEAEQRLSPRFDGMLEAVVEFLRQLLQLVRAAVDAEYRRKIENMKRGQGGAAVAVAAVADHPTKGRAS